MNPFPFRITLSLGSCSRDVPIDFLAQALQSPDRNSALAKLLYDNHPQLMNKGKGAMGDGVLSPPVTVNGDKDSSPSILKPVIVQEEEYCQVGEEPSPAQDSEALACFLAERLRDWRSLGFYRKVARMLPESVVRDALARALDVPGHAIRRSRGAYFTTLIVKSLPTARRSSRSNSPTRL
jgi:hypothetical protein